MARKFSPAGRVLWAEHVNQVPHFAQGRAKLRGARRRGVLYEQRAHEHFENIYAGWLASPWFRYTKLINGRPSRLYWCQPDALILNVQAGICTIVEIKYQHCFRAYLQMVKLYQPVLEKILVGWEFRYCEIVKWYEPSVKFPLAIHMCPEPLAVRENEIGVHIWKP